MNNQLPDHQGTERLKTQSVWPMLAIMTAIWMALSFYSNERVLTPQVLANLARASLWGFSAVIYGMFIQTLRLDLIGPDLTVSEISVVPDSLAALILNPAPTLTMGYHALSLVNLHGLLWIGIVFTFLRFERDVTPPRALLVPLAGWTTISLAQLGFHAFTAQILG